MIWNDLFVGSGSGALVDQTLGKYSIVRSLGIGGMAEVFLCRLRGIGGFDKQVVVKRIRPDIKDEAFVDMFLDEARVAANLSHPNIVHVFEIDEADGLPYIAMEYVRGPTLSNALYRIPKDQPRPYAVLGALFGGVAAGLHYAHNAKDAADKPLRIVHRDISPHNVIISLDGTPKVFDFGVAKARGNLALTGVGSIKGKIAYMATEQLRGMPVDYRADVYALGVCLYEATLGRRPFRGDTEAELFAARVEGVFPRPSELDPSYPPELEEIVLSAMEPDPDRRPSAADLQTALSRFNTGTYAVTAATVAAWVASLYPDEETLELTGEAYAVSDSASGNRDRSSKRGIAIARNTPAQPPAKRRSPLVVLVAAPLLGLTVGGLLYWKLGSSHASAPAIATTPASDAAASNADQVRMYLDEADRLADTRRWDAAGDLLAKAKKLDVTDAALDVRASKLADRIEIGRLRQEAHRAIDAKDRGAAAKAVDALLDRVPDDADAQKMLAELHPAVVATPATLVTPAQPARGAAGTLTLVTHAGAAVYLDGALVDHGSFSHKATRAGAHELVVRLGGFTSVHQTIRIAANKDTKLEVPLTATAPVVATTEPPRDPVPPPHETPPPAPVDAAVAIAPPHHDPVVTPPAPPDAAVATAIVAPRLPASYSARTMKELSKVLGVVEGEAIERGNVPSSIRGVTNGIAEEAFSNFAPGQLIEVHPNAIYYAIVRAVRAGKNSTTIAAELKSAFTQGKL